MSTTNLVLGFFLILLLVALFVVIKKIRSERYKKAIYENSRNLVVEDLENAFDIPSSQNPEHSAVDFPPDPSSDPIEPRRYDMGSINNLAPKSTRLHSRSPMKNSTATIAKIPPQPPQDDHIATI